MSDRSRKKTEDSIKNAFFELLKQQPADKISVRSLCIKAEINRSTFYDHFEDMPHFLDSLQSELAHKCLEATHKYNYDQHYAEVLPEVLTAISDNARLFDLFFDDRYGRKAKAIYKEEVRKECIPKWIATAGISELEADILYNCVIENQFVLWEYWFRNMDNLDKNEFVGIYERILHHQLGNYIYQSD